jgi:hypothetical protein
MTMPIRQTMRRFLLVEAVGFLMAALCHFGVLVAGYQHQAAGTAEMTIAVVLLLGLAMSYIWPGQTRLSGLGAQAFALLGTMVGTYLVVIGVGPSTVPDLVYHVAMLALLGRGLFVAARTHAGVVSLAQ